MGGKPRLDWDERAVSLYAILARDPCDFIDLLSESEPETIQTLYQMLTHKGGPFTDHELNELGADLVLQHAKCRGIEVKPFAAN